VRRKIGQPLAERHRAACWCRAVLCSSFVPHTVWTVGRNVDRIALLEQPTLE